MKIDQATEKRLVYVKALYVHAQQHAKSEAEFDRMIAVHHFDNAVELMLKCIATKENIDFGRRRQINFPTMWDEVDKKLRERNSSLPNKIEIQRLHDFRGDIQHWGVASFSLDVINRYQVYSGDFIRSALKEVFGIEFDELSMSLLVKENRIRDFLSRAEAQLLSDPKESMKCSSAAFSLAEEKELTRINFWFPKPSLKLDPMSKKKIEALNSEIVPIADILSDYWEDEIRESLEGFEEAVKLLALGVDVSEYAKFKAVAPIAVCSNGRVGFQKSLFGEEVGDFTNEKAAFCFNFVLNHVLRWQERW